MKKSSTRQWLIHAVATCTDCGWYCGDYYTAVVDGRNHAKKTGHEVTIETGYAQTYNPKKLI